MRPSKACGWHFETRLTQAVYRSQQLNGETLGCNYLNMFCSVYDIGAYQAEAVPIIEIPVLHEAHARNPTVDLVCINQGESAQRNVFLDARGQALETFSQRGLPTTLFFDAKGRLISARTCEISAETLAEKLESID